MDSTAASRNICGECEIRCPQVLDINVTECINQGFIEAFSREHRRYRIGQIENLSMPLRHFTAPFTGLLRNGCEIAFCTIQGSHECPDAHPTDHINGYTSVLNSLQHSHMSGASSTTSTQHETDRIARHPSSQSGKVCVHISLILQDFTVQLVLGINDREFVRAIDKIYLFFGFMKIKRYSLHLQFYIDSSA